MTGTPATSGKPDTCDYVELTDAECEEFRTQGTSFNDMLRKVHKAGYYRYCGEANATIGKFYAMRARNAIMPARDTIREILLANGFTVKEGQKDIKEYVFRAVKAVFDAALKF